ncbi:hypothetical protein KSP39_PZI008491 [Platanthera zijinensis]|uniref:Uncharacterized protein n=1 Tax=Platanthera zijinensis TaxID=2320716 RepID=A0AAP0BNV8_9ASPA
MTVVGDVEAFERGRVVEWWGITHGEELQLTNVLHQFPVSIADLGGTEIDLRFANSQEGRLFVIVAPVLRFADHTAGTIDGCSVSSFSYTCRDATVRSWDNSCPRCQNLKCKQACPEEVLSAAAMLLHMSRTSRHRSAPKYSSGRNRWPKAPSMKKMKAGKSSNSIINIPDIPIRKANIPSSDHHPTIQRKMDFIPPNGSGRESSSRWSSPTSKVEKDPNQGVPHGNSSFRPSSAPFSARAAEKPCENAAKEPHAKTPSAAFKGSSIRDWIRCRSKRL